MATDPANEAITVRLHLAREMLDDAVAAANDTSAVARVRQLLSIDHSVDLVLSTLLSTLGVVVGGEWNLPRQMTELCAQKPQLRSHATPIERMHRLRNRVQHDGVIPSPEDLRSMMVHAQSFVRDAVREVTGKELEDFTPVSMISDAKARQHLSDAMDALRRGDYAQAITSAAVGFEVAQFNYHAQHVGRETWSERVGDRVKRALERALQDAAQRTRNDSISTFAHNLGWSLTSGELRRVLRDILAPMEMARYGIDIARYGRFQELIPEVNWMMNSEEPKVYTPKGWSPTQQDALFVVDFACSALLLWQQAMEQPEGWRHIR